MNCDLCGSDKNLVKAVIESSTMTVCRSCASYGKILAQAPSPRQQTKRTTPIREPKRESTEIIRGDFSAVLKRKREDLKMKQEELAKKLAVKESLIHKMESGHFIPSISLAKKLGKFLHVRLIENYEETPQAKQNTQKRELTIGDLLKMKQE